MTSTVLVQVPSRVADLAFEYRRPADFVAVPLPPERTDFADPTAFLPLEVTMAPCAAIVFAVAARPAYDDGTLLDWARYLCDAQGILVEQVRAELGGMRAVVADGMQTGEAGPMRMRAAFIEDGARLIVATVLAPSPLWPSVEGSLDAMLRSLTLARPRGATAAIGALPDDASPTAPAPAAAIGRSVARP